jgi:hypothetical protein
LTDNPFRARRLRPGLIPYLFCEPNGFENFLRRWEHAGFRGAIVGPHGSGKSTLLKRVQDWGAERGWDVEPFLIRPEARWRPGPALMVAVLAAKRTALITVDGFEQLPIPLRAVLRLALHLRKCRILVTTHHPAWLPTVMETTLTVTQATKVIEAVGVLGSDHPFRANLARAFQRITMEERLKRHHGSVREVMFELFDEFNRTDNEESGL